MSKLYTLDEAKLIVEKALYRDVDLSQDDIGNNIWVFAEAVTLLKMYREERPTPMTCEEIDLRLTRNSLDCESLNRISELFLSIKPTNLNRV
jgi:hypothetical protein